MLKVEILAAGWPAGWLAAGWLADWRLARFVCSFRASGSLRFERSLRSRGSLRSPALLVYERIWFELSGLSFSQVAFQKATLPGPGISFDKWALIFHF